jgi:hypothetical protein
MIKKLAQRRTEVIKQIIETGRPLNSLTVKVCRSVYSALRDRLILLDIMT